MKSWGNAFPIKNIILVFFPDVSTSSLICLNIWIDIIIKCVRWSKNELKRLVSKFLTCCFHPSSLFRLHVWIEGDENISKKTRFGCRPLQRDRLVSDFPLVHLQFLLFSCQSSSIPTCVWLCVWWLCIQSDRRSNFEQTPLHPFLGHP